MHENIRWRPKSETLYARLDPRFPSSRQRSRRSEALTLPGKLLAQRERRHCTGVWPSYLSRIPWRDSLFLDSACDYRDTTVPTSTFVSHGLLFCRSVPSVSFHSARIVRAASTSCSGLHGGHQGDGHSRTTTVLARRRKGQLECPRSRDALLAVFPPLFPRHTVWSTPLNSILGEKS